MFLLLAGQPRTGADGTFTRIAGLLRGSGGAPRCWEDPSGTAAAASLAPAFLPEDAFDRQPLVDGERVFVCQARIDNREELLRRLGRAPGEPLADSALLAEAYGRFGDACVDEVAGDYAFAAWHRADGRVVAAVDHLAGRRLFWARVEGGLVLSSQLAPVVAHPRVSREPHLEALARLFDAGVERRHTPFRAVHSVPGGHLLEWRPGSEPRIRSWWRPDREPSVLYDDPDAYVEETRELLERAVSAQLRSARAVSCTLSGGLDSGAVTAVAAGLLGRTGDELTAYTAVPEPGLATAERPGWEPDDRGYAEAAAAGHRNLRHRFVAPAGGCVLDVLPALHERARTPSKNTTNLLWIDQISSLAAASGSTAVLCGQRGNATFSWQGESGIWELARRGRGRAAAAQVRAEARYRGKSAGRVLAGAARAGLRATRQPRGASPGGDTPGLRLLSGAQRASLPPPGGPFAEVPGSRAAWAAFATTGPHAFTPDPVAQWGVEWRDPTADRRLVERLLQYPQAAFRVGGRDRGLARAATRGLLPDRVRLRTTRGAQVPEAASLIAARARRYEGALGAMRASAACGELLDLDAVSRSLQALAGGADDLALAIALDRAFDVGLFLARLDGHG